MIRTLDQSKSILEKWLIKNNHVNNTVELGEALSFLENASINKEILEETRIGKVVNEFRRVITDAELAKRAKELVKSWRKLIPENGVKGATITPLPALHSTGPSSPYGLNAQHRRSHLRVAPPSSPPCSSASSSPCLPSRATHHKALSHVNNATKKTARPTTLPNNQAHKPASASFTAEQQKLDSKSSHVVHPKPYFSPHHPSNQIKNSPHSLFNGTLTNQSSPKLPPQSYRFNGNHQFHHNHVNNSSETSPREGSSLKKNKSCQNQNISSKVTSPTKAVNTNSFKGSKRKCESPSSIAGLPKDKKMRMDMLPVTPSASTQSFGQNVLGQHKSNGLAFSKPCDEGNYNSKGPAVSSGPNISQPKPPPLTPKINKVKTTKEIIKDLYAKTPDTFTLSMVNKLASSDSQGAASSHSSNINVPSDMADLSRTSTSPCESTLSPPDFLPESAKKSVDDEIAAILSQLPPLDPSQIDWDDPDEAKSEPPQDLESQQLPGINGHFNKDGEWREFHQVLESTASDNNTLLILPYVIVDD